MSIHSEHPFREPDPDQVRRLRARLGTTVSLWTSGAGADRAGLTVSSYLVITGDPGRVVASLDPDSDLYERLAGSGCAVVHLLGWPDRGLADAFGGTEPAPGGPFRLRDSVQTGHGPRFDGIDTWAAVRLETAVPTGWSMLVTTAVEDLSVGEGGDWLVHRAGRYRHG